MSSVSTYVVLIIRAEISMHFSLFSKASYSTPWLLADFYCEGEYGWFETRIDRVIGATKIKIRWVGGVQPT